ncbi:lipoyl(octanoyl) transferase LipB [Hoyosella rhizosphaerae]|uniref:Octanoyltransferase n=1 Tax=Hoyosella rhizosphaerae TaxID=1755582 RepID=A0A916UFS5_9ACTN|nr:lipoyl(octanoyl) transferase LipB [Hoyosella rhizosphaerae]MBN4927975.1 lipoyl(octanoyl) transferase LipB [Hoyosella rhizosphaerae]GGC71377.1 octanoyltransferase [Hoyosella rhizosphaerae]
MSDRQVSARLSDSPLAIATLGRIDYLDAWARQREIAADRAVGKGLDTLLLLEHPPVYTAGRRTTDEERPQDGTPVIDVDRGGKITWHGPGQLVGYPIIKLAEPIDVVGYVRRLEEALISVIGSYGIRCGRVDGRSGVWLPAAMVITKDGSTVFRPERKIAAIGVRVQRGVTLHGFALNCNNDLGAFDAIIPCGITDAGVTSLSEETGSEVSISDVVDSITDAVRRALDGDMPVTEHHIERLTLEDFQASVFQSSEPSVQKMPKVTTFSFG